MKHFAFILLGVILPQLGFAQWIPLSKSAYQQELLLLQTGMDMKSSYAVDFNYLFTDANQNDTLQEASGALLYNAKIGVTNMKQFNWFIVRTAELELMCDTSEAQLVLKDPSPASQINGVLPQVMSEQLAQIRNIQVRQLGNTRSYLLEFIENPNYVSAEYSVLDGKLVTHFRLTSTPTYMKKEGQEEGQMQTIVMDISYFNYKFGSAVEKLPIQLPTQFLDNQTTIQATRDYQEFEIIDLRNHGK